MPQNVRACAHTFCNVAATMVDLFRDPQLVARVRAEFAAATEAVTYKPYIPLGPAKVP